MEMTKTTMRKSVDADRANASVAPSITLIGSNRRTTRVSLVLFWSVLVLVTFGLFLVVFICVGSCVFVLFCVSFCFPFVCVSFCFGLCQFLFRLVLVYLF